ncbi:MAG TPA: DegT/DnrJ/EryC1/StrS family aminotransferase [Chloroflexota bacterium]|nr:DegT/DnrJ/EryC1/StrS family aminotransferase [Chloroflexota bacterium]
MSERSVDGLAIPLVDLGAQLRPLRADILRAIEDVLDSSQLLLGPQTSAFEDEFASYCGARFCVTVANGTDALHLALRAAGVGPGDEVITVAHTFVATAEAVVLAGAVPVFVDIDPCTYTIDPALIEARITPRTRAIIPVHLYGQMADMDPILAIAAQHHLTVIEDAAQAHGAEYRGRRAGSLGDLGCFSFYFSKNLGAYGESGAVVTSNPDLAARLRRLRDHGSEARYHHVEFGFNARMDEIQAAVLRVKLRHLDDWNAQRREHASLYDTLLCDADVVVPQLAAGRLHVYYVYVVRSADRDNLRQLLHARGIGTGIHFPVPVHLQQASRGLGYANGDLPHAEQAAREVLSLPMYPELTPEQVRCVAEVIRAH